MSRDLGRLPLGRLKLLLLLDLVGLPRRRRWVSLYRGRLLRDLGSLLPTVQLKWAWHPAVPFHASTSILECIRVLAWMPGRIA